ncbi:MAG: hypothetical protein JWM93_2459 [Frankiales bacterium]|nr:hypothetical protein [Frankiales bacterium]
MTPAERAIAGGVCGCIVKVALHDEHCCFREADASCHQAAIDRYKSATPTRALTVRQPWAWAIFFGKDVENRSRRTHYRGPLLIHAGLAWDETAFYPIGHGWVAPRANCPLGVILGTVDVVGCHDDAWCWTPDGFCSPWAQGDGGTGDTFHWELANPRPLPTPIPCKGRLGLWTPPADVLEQMPGGAR